MAYNRNVEMMQQNKKTMLLDQRDHEVSVMKMQTQKRLQIAEAGKQNWRTNQLDKTHREIKNLHYEMTLEEKRKQATLRKNQSGRIAQENGIEEFENNLRRNGIGGDTNPNADLLVTSEDRLLFLERLDTMATSSWPSNAEVGDFMQMLDKRTYELRLAREEKARRKRRMRVEQEATMNEFKSMALNETINESAIISPRVLEATRLKSIEKENRILKAGCDYEEQIRQGENRVRIYCERQRMLAEDQSLDKKEEIASIYESQRKRKEEKSIRNNALCREMVCDFVAQLYPVETDDAIATTSMKGNLGDKRKKGKQSTLDDAANLLSDLLSISKERIGSISSQSNQGYIELSGVDRILQSPASDLWPSFALLSHNLGRWKVSPMSPDDSDDGDYAKLVSFNDSTLNIMQEMFSYSSSTDLVPFSIRLSDMTSQPIPSTVLIMGGDHGLSPKLWLESVSWLNNQYCIWDIYQSCIVSSNIMSAMRTNDYTDCNHLKFNHLSDAFGISKDMQQNYNTNDIVLPPQAVRVLSDIVELMTKIKTCETVLANISDSDFVENIKEFTFSDTTLAMILGLTLWLRRYVNSQYHNKHNYYPLVCQVFVGMTFGMMRDDPQMFLVIDWFARGGNRNNIPEGDFKLNELINEESEVGKPVVTGKKGAAPAKPKPKKVDKNAIPEDISNTCAFDSICWLLSDSRGCDAPLLGQIEESNRIFDVAKSALPTTDVKTIDKYIVSKNKVNRSSQAIDIQMQLQDFSSLSRQIPFVILNTSTISSPDKSSQVLEIVDAAVSSTIIHLGHRMHAVEVACAIAQATTRNITNMKNTVNAISIPTESTEKVTPLLSELLRDNVCNLIASNRETNFSTAQKLWIEHVTGRKMFDMDILTHSYSSILLGRVRHAEVIGTLLTAFLSKLKETEVVISKENALVVEDMKSQDVRFSNRIIVLHEQLTECNKLLNTNRTEAQKHFKSFLKEFRCDVGDVIDARHLSWMKKIELVNHANRKRILDYKNFVLLVCEIFGLLVRELSQENMASALAITRVLSTAGYSTIPWKSNQQINRGSQRSNIQLMKDDIRVTCIDMTLFLEEDCDKQLFEGFGSCSHESIWKDTISHIDKNISSTKNDKDEASISTMSTEDEVMYEVKEQNIQCCVSFLRGLKKSLHCISDLQINAQKILIENAKSRSNYEHQTFREWTKKLEDSFLNPQWYATWSKTMIENETALLYPLHYLNNFEFYLSKDKAHDNVESSSLVISNAVLDVKDMLVDFKFIRLLAVELGKLWHNPDSIEANFDINTLSNEDFLICAIKKLVDTNVVKVPSSWRNSSKLGEFVRLVGADISTKTKFSQNVVIMLLLSNLPTPPTSNFIVSFGKLLTNNTKLNAEKSFTIRLEDLIKIITADQTICNAWWENDDTEVIRKEKVLCALESIAFVCCVSNAAKTSSRISDIVDIDQMIATLCITPPYLSPNINSTEIAFATVPSMTMSYPEIKKPTKNPRFFFESLSKLITVAIKLVINENRTSQGSVNANIISMENKVFGSAISRSQIMWTMKYVESDFTVVDFDVITNYRIMDVLNRQVY